MITAGDAMPHELHDLVISGAQIVDPQGRWAGVGDVGVRSGVISAVVPGHPSLRGRRTISAHGLLLTPGLVDLHTHVFDGQDLGIPADSLLPTGVTTVVDAGSAGAHLYGALHRIAVEPSRVRVRTLLNVSTIGTTSILLAGELTTLAHVDESACLNCVRAHPDEIVGLKIRASHNVGPGTVSAAFERALRLSDASGLPLMVHVGPPPIFLDDVCRGLRSGDIVTHCFSGLAQPPLAGPDGVLPAVAEARARGVLFDVGHGNAGFDAAVASFALAAGFPPDTISTDAHAFSRQPPYGLPSVLDKLVALGLNRTQAFRAVTLAPAAAVGLDGEGVGTLCIGAEADLALFDLIQETVEFSDTTGRRFRGGSRLVPRGTFRQGVELHRSPSRIDQK